MALLTLLLLRSAVALDEDVGHAAALAILGHALVLVRLFGELGNDVPGVYQTGNLLRRELVAWPTSGKGDQESDRRRGGSRTNPSMQSRMLIRESAEQIPHFTQTAKRQQTLVVFSHIAQATM